MIYLGIGSRETPEEALRVMRELASFLAKKGWILRSGAAPGADEAFEEGSDLNNGLKEIYLPWKGFQDNPSLLYSASPEAYEIAKKYHPAWHNLKQGGRNLMARNVHQVLGLDLKTPGDVIVCWTKDGKASGGTGQALRIAVDFNIPIFNLHSKDQLDAFKSWYKENRK